MEEWRNDCNQVRTHGAIGSKTPVSLMNGLFQGIQHKPGMRCAADRSQAEVLFRHATARVRAGPHVRLRLTVSIRVFTRCDRCAHTYMSAICIAATVIFWIN
jgi:hypothetical protein